LLTYKLISKPFQHYQNSLYKFDQGDMAQGKEIV